MNKYRENVKSKTPSEIEIYREEKFVIEISPWSFQVLFEAGAGFLRTKSFVVKLYPNWWGTHGVWKVNR